MLDSIEDMKPPDLELIAAGRAVIHGGLLTSLRERLGMSREHMAELLNISRITYSRWENGLTSTTWGALAERVARFYRSASTVLEYLDQEGIDLRTLEPLSIAAQRSGTPVEQIFQQYRDGELEGMDLGILGVWLVRERVG